MLMFHTSIQKAFRYFPLCKSFLIGSLVLLSLVLLLVPLDLQNPFLFFLSLIIILTPYFGVHVYITAVWHLASVVSVLEPVYGFAAMKKTWELLKGRRCMACDLVFLYLSICGAINGTFASVVVHGGDDFGVLVRIVIG
ncbi:hypothetical protein RJ641_003346 [Dillenia turbinata]|uniref:Uncharacterized protein n=1 Tax=Dillenia turbinata TaxID=194707 RepID=A0AAN8VAU3_9MAGN